MFSNSWSNFCVGRDIFFNNTPMHSFTGEVTAPSPYFPTSGGPFAVMIAMIKAFCPTNIILDFEKGPLKEY